MSEWALLTESDCAYSEEEQDGQEVSCSAHPDGSV